MYTLQAKLKNVNYPIQESRAFPLCIEHKTQIGWAKYSDGVFTIFYDPKYSAQIDEKLKNGGLSHAGNFSVNGIFLLNEVSVVNSPRYPTEVLNHGIRSTGDMA